MFTLKTGTKQQEMIDVLRDENLRLKAHIEQLQRDNRQLQQQHETLVHVKEDEFEDQKYQQQALEETLLTKEREAKTLEEEKKFFKQQYENLQNIVTQMKEIQLKTEHLERDSIDTIAGELDQLLSEAGAFQKSVDNIKKIAKELELLGVNAMIQAAHAGEKGKGFLIVADHINKLSNNSEKNVVEAMVQLNLFSSITRSLTQNFSDTVTQIENNMRAIELLNSQP